MSPKRIRLLRITICRASTRAVGERCGYVEVVSSSVRNEHSRSRHNDVSMLVYMEMASYVKMQAVGGRVIASRRSFRSDEFLKYVGCFWTIGCSC